MTRAESLRSPLARGWSLIVGGGGVDATLLPAPAGMVPTRCRSSWRSPAVTRACRDGPRVARASCKRGLCSPGPRGWSQEGVRESRRGALLPTSAGMGPTPTSKAASLHPAPCACGDGPCMTIKGGDRIRCSPCSRGWSSRNQQRPDRRVLLPALAGMVPTSTCPRLPSPTAPRACGDGPMEALAGSMAAICSLHPRGRSPLSELPSAPSWACAPARGDGPVLSCAPHPAAPDSERPM